MTTNPKARITYRFDRSKEGKRDPYPVRLPQQESGTKPTAETDGKVVRLYPEELQFADDVMPWKSPFQDDPYALERLIRETDARHDGSRASRERGNGRATDARMPALPEEEAVVPDGAVAPAWDAVAAEPAQLPEAAPAAVVPLGLAEEPVEAADGGAIDARHPAASTAPGIPEAAPRTEAPRVPHAAMNGHAGARGPAAGFDPPIREAADRTSAPGRIESLGRGDANDDAGIHHDPLGFDAAAFDGPGVDRTDRPSERSYTGYIAPRRKPAGPSWFKVFASVAGAVLTGALFGYLVLSLFADQPAVPADGEPARSGAAAGNGQTPVGEASADGDSGANPPAAAGDGSASAAADDLPAGGPAVPVDIPTRSYYMIQFGVFSGEEGLEAALGQLRGAGYAAAADLAEGYRAFAGIADSRTDADLLAEQLTGSETFVKQVDVPAASRIAYGGDAEEAEAFFERTDALVRFMSERSTAMLAATKPEPFGDKTRAEWRELHRQWTEAASVFRRGHPEGGEFETVGRAVGTAASAFEAYEDNPSRSHMWTAQTALMEAVLAQKEWLGGF